MEYFQHIKIAPWMVPAAGLFAGLLVGLLLSSLKPLVRLLAALVVAAAVSGLLLLRLPPPAPPTPVAFNDVPKQQETYEQTVLHDYPALKALADGEPEAWQETHRDIAEVLEIHGPDDPGRRPALDAVFQRLDVRLLHGAAAAGDQALLTYLASETALTRTLQAENVQQCAAEALGQGLDATGLSPTAAAQFQTMQSALVAAYLEGGRTPVAPPPEQEGQALMRRAVDPGAHPFTQAELAQFIDRAQQPPAAACALTLKFYDNVQALPSPAAAALLRTVLRTR